MEKLFTLLKIVLLFSMLGSGVGKLMQLPPLVESFNNLGYPLYLMKILGVAYVLGVLGILQPFSHGLKQWSYAGIAFALLGAFLSHLMAGDPVSTAIPALVLFIILIVVYKQEIET